MSGDPGNYARPLPASTPIEVVEQALKLVELYQMEIRCGARNGVVPSGFCQGSIFVEGAQDLWLEYGRLTGTETT